MKYKILLFFVFIAFTFACSSKRNVNENSRLITSFNSEEFDEFFQICKKNSDTIKLYNNSKEFSDFPIFKLDCGKTIILEKSNIKIDPNHLMRNRDDKIILYNFRKLKDKSEFSFYNTLANDKLVLSVDKRNKIKIITRGSF